MKSISTLLNFFKKDKKKIFYPLNSTNLRNKDLVEGIKIMFSKQVTMSRITEKFENEFKKKINVKNAFMVNSGSSANLLAFQCLINPYRSKRLSPGDEILIPTVCWSTSLWPIVQSGLKPVFVDVDKKTFNISLRDLKSKINKKTKAIMLIHVLGNCTNMNEIIKIKKKHNLILIEDSCESLGAKYKGKKLGTFGEFSTFSFYISHQISSMEGGMITCQTEEDSEIIKSLRSHGYARDLKNQKKIEKANKNINGKFLFYNSGFNLRPTDVQAAIGLSQFKSLKVFIRNRAINRKNIIKSLKKDKRWNSQVDFLEKNNNVEPSWFGIAMLINEKYKHNKEKILRKINKLGIETRPIISGNFTKQPSVKKYKLVNKIKKFPNADFIHKFGFFIGLQTEVVKKSYIAKFNDKFFKAFTI